MSKVLLTDSNTQQAIAYATEITVREFREHIKVIILPEYKKLLQQYAVERHRNLALQRIVEYLFISDIALLILNFSP